MNAKEYLSVIRQLDIKIGQKLSELDDLQDMATSIGSFDYTKDRVQTSLSGEAPFTRVAEKAAEIDADICRLVNQRESIIEEIRALDDPRYIDILYRRYAEHKRFETIGEEMSYNWRYVYQLHSEALEAFETGFLKNI